MSAPPPSTSSHPSSVPPTIPGTKADETLARDFRFEVATLLNRTATSFPGAQPVSFALRHIRELQDHHYYVCEKTDGIRCLLYLTDDKNGGEISYFIDRRNDYYYVPGLHFPLADDASLQDFHRNTLIDGELVLDTQANGSRQLKYLVFDCLVLDGKSLMHRTLDKRIAYFASHVYKPYQELYKKFPEEIQYLPFIVELKRMEFSYAIEHMFNVILPGLPHGNDGLIFTRRDTPYTHGTDQHILKWKPAAENSVDFRMHLVFPTIDQDDDGEMVSDGSDTDPDPEAKATATATTTTTTTTDEPMVDYDAVPAIELAAFHGSGSNQYFATLHLPPEDWAAMVKLDAPLEWSVVECAQDDAGRWRFMRLRGDKKEANHITTVQSVLESIQDRVGQEDLIRVQGSIRTNWKERELREKNAAQQHQQQQVGKVNGSVPG